VTLSKVRSEILHGLPHLITTTDLCVYVCLLTQHWFYPSWTKRHNNFKIMSKKKVLKFLKVVQKREKNKQHCTSDPRGSCLLLL